MSLLALLQQAAASAMPPRAEDTIEVTANQDPARVDGQGPSAPFMGNRSYLEEAAMANNEPLPEEVTRQRRGLFGSRGTIRNVLGALGDAMLIAGGNDPIYAPRVQRERLSDAMVGYTASPEAAMAAVERVTQIDPEAGRVLLEQMQADAIRRGTLENQQSSQAATNLNRGRDDARALSQVAANMFRAAGSDPANIDRALGILERMAGNNGLTLAQIGIVPGMTPEDYAMYSEGGWNVNQQMNYPLAVQRVEQGQQNADTARINATRPRAQAQPRAQTSLEYYQELSGIPRNRRTPEQQAFMDDFTGQSGNRERTNRPASSRSGAPTRRLVMPRNNN